MTRGCPAVPTTTIRIVRVAVVDHVRVKTSFRATGVAENRLTVLVRVPLMYTRAEPMFGPVGLSHATRLPLNVRVALLPAVTEYLALPPTKSVDDERPQPLLNETAELDSL